MHFLVNAKSRRGEHAIGIGKFQLQPASTQLRPSVFVRADVGEGKQSSGEGAQSSGGGGADFGGGRALPSEMVCVRRAKCFILFEFAERDTARLHYNEGERVLGENHIRSDAVARNYMIEQIQYISFSILLQYSPSYFL